MKKYAFFFLMIFILPNILLSENANWELKLDKDIYKVLSSPDGNKFIYIIENDDNLIMNCLNANDGKVMWTKELKNISIEYSDLFRFVDDNSIYACESNQHLFLESGSGKVIKQYQIYGDDWDDILYKKGLVTEGNLKFEPQFQNDIGVFFGSDGIQILDLKNQTMIYSSNVNSGTFSLLNQENYSLISIGSDSIIILDNKERKIVLKDEIGKFDLNSRFTPNIIAYNNSCIMYCDENILLIDLKTGKSKSVKGDPVEYDYVSSLIINNEFYLIISKENTQSLLNTSTGDYVFKLNKDEIQGIVYEIVMSEDKKSFIIFSANNDEDEISCSRVEPGQTKVSWSKSLLKYNGSYETNHIGASAGSKLLGGIATGIVRHALGTRDNFRSTQYHNVMKDNFFSGLINNSINESLKASKHSCLGIAKYISSKDGKISIVCAGDIKMKVSQTPDDDEEGFVTLDFKDGSLISYNKCEIMPAPVNSNIINVLKINSTFDGAVICGTSDFYLYHNGNIEKFNYKDSKVQYIGDNGFSMLLTVNQNDDYTDLIRLDINKESFKFNLLVRSFFNNSFDTSGFYRLNQTLLMKKDEISMYDLKNMNVDNSAFVSPKWTVKCEDIKLKDFFSKDEESKYKGFLQGVSYSNHCFIFASDYSLSIIKDDGICKWSEDWEQYFDDKSVAMVFEGKNMIFNTMDKACIYTIDCPNVKLLDVESSRDDYSLCIAKNNSGVLFANNKKNISYFKIK